MILEVRLVGAKRTSVQALSFRPSRMVVVLFMMVTFFSQTHYLEAPDHEKKSLYSTTAPYDSFG